MLNTIQTMSYLISLRRSNQIFFNFDPFATNNNCMKTNGSLSLPDIQGVETDFCS